MSDDKTTHLVGTYNISFAADDGNNPNHYNLKGFSPSETTFGIGRLHNNNIRKFYNNAIERVKTFLNEPDFSFIGLQEINDSRKGKNLAGETIYGDKNLQNMVETYNTDSNKQIALCFDSKFDPKNPDPTIEGLAIIWNVSKLGHKKSHKIVNMFHDYDEEDYVKKAKEDSRPMLMVLTSNNYLLVNCHGRNDPGASARTMKNTANFISSEINIFLAERVNDDDSLKNEIVQKTFIAGDFNDRFDGFNKITVNGRKLFYNGQAPRSCCYNRDSSCIENKFYNKKKIEELIKNDKEIPSNILDQFKSILNKDKTDSLSIEEIKDFLSKKSFLDRPDVGLCDGNPGPPKSSMSFGNIKNEDTNAAGDIANYRYYGDKIFGAEPANEPTLTIYPDYNTERINAPSKESDHEMVIGTFFTEGQGQGDSARARARARSSARAKASSSARANRIYDFGTADAAAAAADYSASEGGRKRKTRRMRKTKRRTRKTKRKQRRVSLKKKRRTTKRK